MHMRRMKMIPTHEREEKYNPRLNIVLVKGIGKKPLVLEGKRKGKVVRRVATFGVEW